MSIFTFNALRKKVEVILMGVVDTIDQYPQRSKYNRVIGGYTKSQKDVMNDAIAAIKQINVISNGMFKKDVFNFEEDVTPEINGGLADEE